MLLPVAGSLPGLCCLATMLLPVVSLAVLALTTAASLHGTSCLEADQHPPTARDLVVTLEAVLGSGSGSDGGAPGATWEYTHLGAYYVDKQWAYIVGELHLYGVLALTSSVLLAVVVVGSAFTQCRSECHIRSRDPSNTICTQLFDHLLAGIAERLGASCWKCGMYTALCLSLAGDATAMKLLLGWRDLRAACYSNGR
jgi:hypothetical protein